MKRLMLVALLTLVSACNGSPTSPTPPAPTPPVPPVVVVPEPEPTPVPVPPIPTPQPRWIAAIEFEHWFGPSPLSGHFDVEWRYDDLWFGQLAAHIIKQDASGIFAVVPGTNATDGSKIQITFYGPTYGTWSFNGLQGQAVGTIEFK